MLEYGTSAEVREKLIAARLIRVDGLNFSQPGSEKKENIKGLLPECRRVDSNNSMFGIAVNGETWIGSSSENLDHRDLTQKRKNLIKELGLERGFWVPCSNSENLDWYHLVKRLADPDWDPS